jgi:hypothetical protein
MSSVKKAVLDSDPARRTRHTLEELLEDVTPHNVGSEVSAGGPVGKEWAADPLPGARPLAKPGGVMATMGVFEKLNLKAQTEIVVLGAPPSFEVELGKLQGVKISRSLPKRARVAFALAFVTKLAEVESIAKSLSKLAEGDPVIWVAYPKGSSKRYKCEFNRDTGWAALGAAGFEAVRQVAIDEDWSALRFRRAEFIKAMTRDPSRAMSAEGSRRVARKRA